MKMWQRPYRRHWTKYDVRGKWVRLAFLYARGPPSGSKPMVSHTIKCDACPRDSILTHNIAPWVRLQSMLLCEQDNVWMGSMKARAPSKTPEEGPLRPRRFALGPRLRCHPSYKSPTRRLLTYPTGLAMLLNNFCTTTVMVIASRLYFCVPPPTQQ
jgi:hypothetical protein